MDSLDKDRVEGRTMEMISRLLPSLCFYGYWHEWKKPDACYLWEYYLSPDIYKHINPMS